jgi:Flp pilus assembly protein TadD
MAGLALGGYLAGRHVNRFQSKAALLAFYGRLEIGVAVYALVLPFLIAAATPLYRTIYDPLLNHFWCYQAFAFLGCAMLLITPAGLMGATLPVLCRFYVNHLGHLGARTGWLYGLNTVGAALGSILCGFVLVKSLGVRATLGLGAAINLLVGAAGREEEAAQELRTTMRLDPRHKRAYTALGLLLAENGKLDEAARCFARILEMWPPRAAPYKYLGMIDLRRGDVKQAISNLSKARQLQPDDPEIHGELGLAHLCQGGYQKAVTSFSRALAQNPRDADAHYNLALAYKRLGNLQKAREHFSAASRSDRNNHDSR